MHNKLFDTDAQVRPILRSLLARAPVNSTLSYRIRE
jgi:hypothetical protein